MTTYKSPAPIYLGSSIVTLKPASAFATDTVVQPSEWLATSFRVFGQLFTSMDSPTIPSIPITMSFAPSFGPAILTIYGALNGNTAIGYDSSGRITTSEYVSGRANPDGTIAVSGTNINPNTSILYLIPGQAVDDTGNRIPVIPSTDVIAYSLTVPGPAAPPPITPPPVPIDSVDLSTVIQFSERSLTRTYTKGTLLPIQTETFSVKNVSNTLTVSVNMQSPSGVTFTPSVLLLVPGQSQNVVISFDTSTIDKLPEGTSIVNAIISLSQS